MTTLTRRRSEDAREECWHIYFTDVRVGTIAIRIGTPNDEDPWGWICGFYPGSHPGECCDGTAPTFEQARVDFEIAWREFSAKRTAANYRARREHRDGTAWKYAMWDAGLKMPTATATGVSRCFCGATITIADFWDHSRTAHRMTE
jgi:hypothetical protein